MTIKEVYEYADNYRQDVWDSAADYEREPKVFLHWTAGHYDQISDDVRHGYHIAITGDGEVYLLNDFNKTTAGTWRRNSGAINVAICGCWDAGSNNLGSEPPTERQIDAMAQVIAAVCEGLWLTIDKVHVLTHGEAANCEDGEYPHRPYAWWNDSYDDGNTRGDLEYLGTDESPCYNPKAKDGSRGGDVLRGKALYYKNKWDEEGHPWDN